MCAEFSELTEGLEKLTLHTDELEKDTEVYYRIMEETVWHIQTAKSALESDNSVDKSLCRLTAIGGLNEVIEEISEIIELALRNTPVVQGWWQYYSIVKDQ